MLNRRQFVKGAMTAAGTALVARLIPNAAAADLNKSEISSGKTETFTPPNGAGYKPVITTNGATLPWKMVDGVKVYHMTAEPVTHEFAPGLVAECWGYNGRVHGPTIEAVEGDRVRIYVTNKLPEATTVHWHGLFLPNGMDGVGGLTQKAIQPGETFMYEFPLIQHGTFMYHPHHDEMTQMAMGMMGLFIIHPREPKRPTVDHDFAIMLSEWAIDVGARRPNPSEMTDFNVLTMNARCFPGTAPLVVKKNSRVRIRIGNLSAMDHHPIHLHGHRFLVTNTDGGEIPESARWPETTVLVAVGQTRTVEFIADAPGDWAMHCHMSHHVMTQMGHHFGNVIGMDTAGLSKEISKLVPGYMAMGQDGMGDMGDMGMPVPKNSLPMVGAEGQFDYITMGGMFTILKVRDEVPADNADPGWYQNPPGTVSDIAPESDLKRDGIQT
jgi:FtsP/CotA-like multicopper oxidase with cupredoxin domain